ncbi:hypothetical protein WR25_08844 [Diploscapter pachys]|uniref:Uncharacterized protein n=1 Tax=Diploscapter pachys TaxID=2018661 RepID=A0A2A2JAR8_9BILA|nr:hypothetical protein WR25_08844 [Diploscapter pachys]
MKYLQLGDKLNVHPLKVSFLRVDRRIEETLLREHIQEEGNVCLESLVIPSQNAYAPHSHLDTSNSELLERSDHLGSCIRVIPRMGDDLDEQGVVVGRNDGAREGRGRIQTDAHSLARTEHLNSARVWLEIAGWVLCRHSALDG